MFVLKVENEKGELLPLTQNEGDYQVISVTGLNPPVANINTSTVVGMDGVKYISGKLEARNVVLTIRINGDVAKNRQRLYSMFPTRRWCKLFFTTETRDVYTEGYVETVENDLFQNGQTMQVSVLCPDPYLLSLAEIVTDISRIIGAFEFPTSIDATGVEFSTYVKYLTIDVYNEGESETGIVVTIKAIGGVTNPMIYDISNGTTFKLNVTMESGDVITINTNRGQKGVTLLHDGVTINLINKVDKSSTWFSLSPGGTSYGYDADSGVENMIVGIKHRHRFIGI